MGVGLVLEVSFVWELVQGSAKDLAHLAPEWCGPLWGLLASSPCLEQVTKGLAWEPPDSGPEWKEASEAGVVIDKLQILIQSQITLPSCIKASIAW